jgi:flagella basal body P-ring formation protein FlgA
MHPETLERSGAIAWGSTWMSGMGLKLPKEAPFMRMHLKCSEQGPKPERMINVALSLLIFVLSPVGAQTFNSAQLASLSTESDVTRTNPLSRSSAAQLQNEARNWLTQQLSLQVEQVQIAEMDPRLKFDACANKVVFDHPFANRQVIRARCETPNWQFFLKASFKDEQAALKANSINLPIAPSKPSTASVGGVLKSTGQAYVPSTVNTALSANKVKTVLVANQPLRRGTLLQPSHFKQVELAIALTDAMVLSQFKEIENTELLHDMGVDQTIRNYDIKPTLMVKRGQQVNFSVGEGRGFLITIKAEAQQDGSLGDQIRLKNVESGRLISGVITGLNEARAL